MIGELELAWRLLPNRFVAVTGTNGKTTVTELLGHVWRTAAEPVAVAGNVGTPLASLAGEVAAEATVVCECSSFQLEDSEAFAPECAVLLNVDARPPRSPRRLRRLPARQAPDLRQPGKRRRRRLQRLRGGAARSRPRRLRAGGWPTAAAPTPDCEVSLNDGVIFAGTEPLLEASELSLLGPHNADNAMAAAAAALAMGLERDAVREGLRTFAGVPHRLERVAEIGGVLYVNDSKATNVAAAAAALRSFDGGVRAILGGSLKGGGFEGLVEPVSERCVACYLIGEAAEPLERRPRARPRRRRGAAPLRRPRRRGPRGGRATRARRGGPARPGLRELRRLPRLRGARRALPLPGRGARAGVSALGANIRETALSLSRWARDARRRRPADRVQPAAHRHPVPARLRRRDGVQRQLDDLRCWARAGTAPTT